ncbi:DUF2634 domain-containing protein [Paenibacillus puldeungensis]|uniref:DUF2634 domain-containing protein n=1 Tax=Paenibacillus puldeungensis TaxID=696536 RepID=A0ABW3RY78_9BACL
MPLSPLRSREERFEEIKPLPLPSRTYYLDFETGQVVEKIIDGKEAIKQFIRKAIQTARYRFLIYNSQYGCEIETLLGQDISPQLLNSEVKRVIVEALREDDRIQGVEQFQIIRESDKLFVAFTVQTTKGIIEQEVTI